MFVLGERGLDANEAVTLNLVLWKCGGRGRWGDEALKSSRPRLMLHNQV